MSDARFKAVENAPGYWLVVDLWYDDYVKTSAGTLEYFTTKASADEFIQWREGRAGK